MALIAGHNSAADHRRADKAGDDADRLHQKREHHPLVAERGVTEHDRRDHRDRIAFEHVGRHAGAVADVIADVVRDGRRVARVVFRDGLFHLADEVRPHVGRLGVNAAANAHEECEQRTAEAVADEDFVSEFAEHEQNDRTAEEAEAAGEHAGNGAGAVRQTHRVAEVRSAAAATRRFPAVASRIPIKPTLAEKSALPSGTRSRALEPQW